MSAPEVTCRELITLLLDYLTGELPQDQASVFEEHLEICPACRAYLETYNKTSEISRLSALRDECEEVEELEPCVVDAILGTLGR